MKNTKFYFVIGILICLFTNSCSISKVVFGIPNCKKNKLTFEKDNLKSNYKLMYPDTISNLYLRELREKYQLSSLIKNTQSEKEKVLIILDWTHKQWIHNGNNEPTKNAALNILNEAKEGKRFRCVEYGIVSTEALLSVNISARVLALKTKDVETRKSGAGHVLTEVWLSDLNKWALIDPQFNIMPIMNGVPLNAIEFQDAIIDKKPFELVNVNGDIKKSERRRYLNFITCYLYYFDTKFDQRIDIADQQIKYEGKPNIMLVPKGAKNPTIFQIKYPIKNCVYTNSILEFYKKP